MNQHGQQIATPSANGFKLAPQTDPVHKWSGVRLVQNIVRHRQKYFVTTSFKRVEETAKKTEWQQVTASHG